ncbi:type II toxin-antitoxin system RelE family toxin [Bifidobacterium jacchi]|uniref:Type II toxin-antitoxin system RelE/ParE family toxin n=1 Tax=Bifidobacterium jacchi TaxID=2490545 RepID=A0A5N5RGG7_9BIFI|nr:type II toxin-antitoxin system RelE/ParE family toxin [Bifidobacterium jacchi]KAB5606357.1 type II toxin-antitoxin system RelE/ParE family toxin [Bifidobacterium jacchi]
MTGWIQRWLPEAEKDIAGLDSAMQRQILQGIRKVAANPLPVSEGGYGKPLRNGGKAKLSGLCKIKFRGIGVRVVYKAIRVDRQMVIVVVGVRSDDEVYRIADARRARYGL